MLVKLRVLLRLFKFLKITWTALMFWRFRKKSPLSRKQRIMELRWRLKRKFSRKYRRKQS